eukprot:m.135302 g.135302  ORF g.135302 m.135302 type:complete len:570 (-) comp9896_c0_seq1:1398-3107(-)
MGDLLDVEVLVIGAGPTGLGAATRLHQHQHPSWLVVDGFSQPGGLARSELTKEGFLFDLGGHVIFSHYKYFDQLLEYAVGKGGNTWSTIERVSFVWIKDRYVPYPFQNNLSVLDVEDQITCLEGLIDANINAQSGNGTKPKNFDEWMVHVMGSGIASMFMRPYNFKVWAIPPTSMQWEWLGDRSNPIDLKASLRNVLRRRRAPAPKATFQFPLNGGTGAIWSSIADLLPQERIRYRSKVVGLDIDKKIVTLNDKTRIRYQACVSTMPLDYTLRLIGLNDVASKLFYSSSHVIGIGIRGKIPHGRKCWLYYPEDNCPFYRCTCFSTYSKNNCPPAEAKLPTMRVAGDATIPPSEPKEGPYWSLMFEVSESPIKKVNKDTVIEETIQGALNVHLIQPEDEIVSVYHRHLPHGYPTPSTMRDTVLNDTLPFLKSKGLWSRGRFGSYKYEVANQDHSVVMGVEAVDNILFGASEITFEHPKLVAQTKNTDLTYSPPMHMQEFEEEDTYGNGTVSERTEFNQNGKKEEEDEEEDDEADSSQGNEVDEGEDEVLKKHSSNDREVTAAGKGKRQHD